MLEHYRSLGIASFSVNVNVREPGDPCVQRVEEVVRAFGTAIASVTTGAWLHGSNQAIYSRVRALHPDDWFVLADCDELQAWPGEIASLVAWCERRGYDHIEGCFVDRLAPDGGFPDYRFGVPLGEQYPLGAYLSYPLGGANPCKVVAAKGSVELGPGQHFANGGSACPAADMYVPVHHFKWTGGIVERLRRRAASRERARDPYWDESARIVEHCDANGGGIDLADPRFLTAPCEPAYAYWDAVKRECAGFAESRRRRIVHGNVRVSSS
ncbi:MAG: hypothetical protein QOD51_1535 [Candidatus Eremiobacteraeota bacterium]|nr:hypothetical protein [Candidatus Eremiobacteraeota bacterium]